MEVQYKAVTVFPAITSTFGFHSLRFAQRKHLTAQLISREGSHCLSISVLDFRISFTWQAFDDKSTPELVSKMRLCQNNHLTMEVQWKAVTVFPAITSTFGCMTLITMRRISKNSSNREMQLNAK
jgi:hypothetical protein